MGAWSTESAREPRVDDLVLEILSEASGRIAFNGLRRALGVHPESLSRALRRLERVGLVSRLEDGYTLREPLPRTFQGGMPQTRTVASVQLPPGTQSVDVFGRLAGRWFGTLRWVGVYEIPGDPRLVWSYDGAGGHVMLSVRRGTVRVLTDAPLHSDGHAERAAYTLLGRALDRIREEVTPSETLVAMFHLGQPPATGIPN